MVQKNALYSGTTIAQRVRLFSVWEKSGSVEKACQEAQVSRSTFYYWKPRFIEGGYEALEERRSHAPKNPRTIGPKIAEEALKLRRANPNWGKAKISKEMNQQHHCRVISPNTVRRILVQANLWR